jgi:hypothetical protein
MTNKLPPLNKGCTKRGGTFTEASCSNSLMQSAKGW